MLWIRPLLILTIAGLLVSCAEMTQVLKMLDVKEPTARISNVKISKLSLQQVDLLFDVAIDNPNNVGVHLNGFDYDLQLDGASFIKGNKEDKLDVGANGSATVAIPLSLTFNEIREAVKAVSTLDTIPYRLNLGVGLDVPALGTIRVPVSKSGSVPNLKLPRISLSGIKLDNIGFTSASLKVNLMVDNPNTLGFSTSNFNYNLTVNGKNWVSGLLEAPLQIEKKQKQTVSIPVKLDFMQMGSAVYQLLTGNNSLNYELTGKADFKSDLEFLKAFTLPIQKNGTINLTK